MLLFFADIPLAALPAIMAIGAATTAVSTAAGATLSILSAQAQNSAIKRSQKQAAANAAIQQTQLSQAAGTERQKRLQEAQQMEGRLRVASGEAGVQYAGSSFEQLSVQNDITTAQNLDVLGSNLQNQYARVQSGATADIAALEAQKRNPVLEGIQGGLQFASTGLSLTGSAMNLGGKFNGGQSAGPKQPFSGHDY